MHASKWNSILFARSASWARAALFLAVFICLIGSPRAETVRIVTPESPPSAPVRKGMRALEDVFRAREWDVSVAEGPAAAGVGSPDVEIIVAPFDPNAFPPEQAKLFADVVSDRPESFSIMRFQRDGGTRIYTIGRDAAGAMYGAFDLAGQLEAPSSGASIFDRVEERRGAPTALVRGVLVNVTRDALEDSFSWFHSEAFWTSFLDRAARARFNLIALRGVFDMERAGFVNAAPFFSTESGADPETASRNRASLNRILQMASEYAINVTFETTPPDPGALAPGDLRLGVKSLLDACPLLSGFGFSLAPDGTAQRDAFLAILGGMTDAGGKTQLMLASEAGATGMADALSRQYQGGTVAEVPLNAARWGLDYILPGEAGSAAQAEETWRMLTIPRPYALLFRIQAYPLMETVPWGDADFIRNIMRAARIGSANGFIVELAAPYAPHRAPDSKTSPPDLRYSNWMHDRDWYAYDLWGRLGYNPEESNSVFIQDFQTRFGQDAGEAVFNALQQASGVLPALQPLLPLMDESRRLPIVMRPPAALADWLVRPVAEPFSTRSVRDEVDFLIASKTDGRRSPREALVKALDGAARASEAMNALNAKIHPQAKGAQGLLSDREIKRYQEWRSWSLDFQLVETLGRCWLDQIDAAVQYGLYQNTNDAAAIVACTEKLKQSTNDWKELLDFTGKRFRAMTVFTPQGFQQKHWSDMETPFDSDQALVSQAYTYWTQDQNWTGRIGHWPTPRVTPHEPFLVTASIPPRMLAQDLTLVYRNSAGDTKQLLMQPTRVDGIYYAEIASDLMVAGRLEYYFIVKINGKSTDIRDPKTGRPYTVTVSNDDQPPRMDYLRHSINDARDHATILGDFIDLTGVAEANLLWRPIGATSNPDGSSPWNRTPMQRNDPQFFATVPLTPQGLIYAVEINDRLGNARLYPASPEIPYMKIDSFTQ
ncbi:MAG: hypothetical protein GC154_09890 [bacterium]|nr:hypothetical protein [bacterium]